MHCCNLCALWNINTFSKMFSFALLPFSLPASFWFFFASDALSKFFPSLKKWIYCYYLFFTGTISNNIMVVLFSVPVEWTFICDERTVSRLYESHEWARSCDHLTDGIGAFLGAFTKCTLLRKWHFIHCDCNPRHTYPGSSPIELNGASFCVAMLRIAQCACT